MRAARLAVALAVAALAAALLLPGCPDETPIPGEVLGTFNFPPDQIKLVQDDCHFESQGDAGGLDPFVATLSYDSKGQAWLTSGATQIAGTWQGDSFTVETDGVPRDLPPPCVLDGGLCPGTISERVEGRLFGAVQDCVTALQADAGQSVVFMPDGGTDVQLVCGYITDQFVPVDSAACGCASCLVVYSISGYRQ